MKWIERNAPPNRRNGYVLNEAMKNRFANQQTDTDRLSSIECSIQMISEAVIKIASSDGKSAGCSMLTIKPNYKLSSSSTFVIVVALLRHTRIETMVIRSLVITAWFGSFGLFADQKRTIYAHWSVWMQQPNEMPNCSRTKLSLIQQTLTATRQNHLYCCACDRSLILNRFFVLILLPHSIIMHSRSITRSWCVLRCLATRH